MGWGRGSRTTPTEPWKFRIPRTLKSPCQLSIAPFFYLNIKITILRSFFPKFPPDFLNHCRHIGIFFHATRSQCRIFCKCKIIPSETHRLQKTNSLAVNNTNHYDTHYHYQYHNHCQTPLNLYHTPPWSTLVIHVYIVPTKLLSCRRHWEKYFFVISARNCWLIVLKFPLK